MDILEDHDAGITTIALRGRLDADSAPGLQARLVQLVDSGVHQLVMDLSQLTFTNSVGLRVFLVVAKRLAGVQFVSWHATKKG